MTRASRPSVSSRKPSKRWVEKDPEIKALYKSWDEIGVRVRKLVTKLKRGEVPYEEVRPLLHEWREVGRGIDRLEDDKWQDLRRRMRASGVNVP